MTDRSSDYQLVDLLEDKNVDDIFLCGICLDILHRPTIMCRGGHCWCRSCINKIGDKDTTDKKCPICPEIIDLKNPIKNLALQTLIEAKVCFCPEKYCQWKGTVGTFDKHWQICSQAINLISDDEKQKPQDENDDIEDQIEETQVFRSDNNYDMEFENEDTNTNIPKKKGRKRSLKFKSLLKYKWKK